MSTNERGGRKGLLAVSIFIEQLKRSSRCVKVSLNPVVKLAQRVALARPPLFPYTMRKYDRVEEREETGNENIKEALRAKYVERKVINDYVILIIYIDDQ